MSYPVTQDAAGLPSFKTPTMSSFSNQPSNVPHGSSYNSGIGTSRPLAPPLPPPRNPSYSYSGSYSNPYFSDYGSYPSYYNRPMFNSYSPYSSNSYMMPGAGYPSSFEQSFIKEAHDSSREAFANIESVVGAFSSINMMIESTYHALRSSFNAVLSVAENMSKLKLQFGQVLSAFTFIRSLQWLYKKLLYLIGLRKVDPTTESAWKSASKSFEDTVDPNTKKSSWPVVLFFLAVYAGPFVMWKFINSFMKQDKSKDSWEKKNGDYYYAIAKYKYDAQHPEELSFSAGEYLKLAPYENQTDKSWPLATNGKRTGVIPINYVDVRYKSAQANETLANNRIKTSNLLQNQDKSSSPIQPLLVNQNERTQKQRPELLTKTSEMPRVENGLSTETSGSLHVVHEASQQAEQLTESLSKDNKSSKNNIFSTDFQITQDKIAGSELSQNQTNIPK